MDKIFYQSSFPRDGDHKIRKEVKPVPETYNELLGQQLSQNIVNTYPWFYEYFKY